MTFPTQEEIISHLTTIASKIQAVPTQEEITSHLTTIASKMVIPTQDEITGHLSTITSKAFEEVVILTNKHGPWISGTLTTWSSTAPQWVVDLLDQTILRYTIGDEFDSFRAANTAIALLTAWAYYRTLRVTFSIIRFWLRTILGIYWTVRSILGIVYGVLSSTALWFFSFFSSEHRLASDDPPGQAGGSRVILPGSRQNRHTNGGQRREPGFVANNNNNNHGNQMPRNTAVPAVVPTVIHLRHPIPVLPPAFSPQRQHEHQHQHQHQHHPEQMQAERVGSSMIPQQEQQQQQQQQQTPQQTPRGWVPPLLPPGVLRYHTNGGSVASPFIPIASYPTRPPPPQQQQQQQQQQFPPANDYVNPSSLPQIPVAFAGADADADASDTKDSKEREKLCIDSEDESDHDGGWNEENCLRAMLSVNSTKNTKHGKRTAPPVSATKKPDAVASASVKATTSKEQVNKRKRGAKQLETENTEPTRASKKQRIAQARANAKKWANQTFGDN
eukprot:jgi/Psemu1/29670/gm1.29670_g